MPRSRFIQYTIAVVVAAVAVEIRLALEPVWGLKVPLITMFPAVMVSAWVGGFWPGMVTTTLCAAAAAYLWMEPAYSLAVAERGDMLAIIAFIVIGGLISALNEAHRRMADAAAASREQLHITLTSIGDAVIATDPAGRVTLMNSVAERLTGWTSGEALGRPLPDVFVLIDEESGATKGDPALRAIHEESAGVLSGHPVLRAKHGGEIPIDDSAAPIRTAHGEIVGAVVVFREIGERRRHEQTLNRLAAIVEASEDAIVAKTLDGTITSWNPGAERMFGYAAEEAVGRPITMLVPPESGSQEADLRRRLATGERIDHFETERVRKDGRRLRVSVSLAPLRNEHGSIVGISMIARDVTEHAQLFAAEREARAEAARANRTKDEFIAVLSHELRQPLNTMLGWARALRRTPVDPGQLDRALEAIERNGQAQARMIDDLLDVARIEAGKVTLDRRDVDVAGLVAEVVHSLQHEAKRRGLLLGTEIGMARPTLSADADRLRQVLMNLLGNAMKYTPSGGQVLVRLSEDGGDVRIAVTDTGVGIGPDLLPHVFERFRQADASRDGAQGGLGLGLAIVRDIVELHGGAVEAQSDGPDRGATFVVTLPR